MLDAGEWALTMCIAVGAGVAREVLGWFLIPTASRHLAC